MEFRYGLFPHGLRCLNFFSPARDAVSKVVKLFSLEEVGCWRQDWGLASRPQLLFTQLPKCGYNMNNHLMLLPTGIVSLLES